MPKALFLDRDGTINFDYGYVYQKESFEFINGIFELCQKAQSKGYLIIVVTNQSGIARGYYTDDDFEAINQYMVDEFAKNGVKITDVFYCPELSGNRRKPECGMFLEAKEKYDIDMKASVSLGDKQRDVEAAQKAGCGKNFLFDGDFSEVMEEL